MVFYHSQSHAEVRRRPFEGVPVLVTLPSPHRIQSARTVESGHASDVTSHTPGPLEHAQTPSQSQAAELVSSRHWRIWGERLKLRWNVVVGRPSCWTRCDREGVDKPGEGRISLASSCSQ
jgi:hypothetical protein